MKVSLTPQWMLNGYSPQDWMICCYKQKTSFFCFLFNFCSRFPPPDKYLSHPLSPGLPLPCPPLSPSTKTKTYVKPDNLIDKGLNSVGLWHRSKRPPLRRKTCSLHTSQRTGVWHLRIQLQKEKKLRKIFKLFKMALR